MTEAAKPEPIKNLWRNTQVDDTKQEIRQMKAMLEGDAAYRKHITDINGMKARHDRLARQLEEFTPRAYAEEDKDRATRRFRALAEEIKVGMPSQEVMRRNPPGAVQRNIWWQEKNKRNIQEYKHIGLRLQAGGDVDDPTIGDAISNVEMLRPATTSHDSTEMDRAQIPKTKDIHLNENRSVVITEAEEEVLHQIDPDLAGMLATLSADQRQLIKDAVGKVIAAEAAQPEVEKPPSDGYTIQQLRKIAAENGIRGFGRKKVDLLDELTTKGLI